MTPEERKVYYAKWYVQNKDKHLEKLLANVSCECGFETAYCNLKRHQKTKLHQKKLLSKI